MKLSDFLSDIGRPISYYPGLRQITGSTTATIFLCQLFYWTGKEQSGDGWIYKTSEELEEETGLSYDEQKTARAKLVERDLIEENYARLEHKMYFRVKTDILNALWEIPEHGNAKMGNVATPDSSNVATPSSLNSNTETTIEYQQKGEGLKIEAKSMPLEWQIANNQMIDPESLQKASAEKEATDSFERSLGFGPLPWNTSTMWEKLFRFVVKVYAANPAVFADFQAWREGPGKYKGWTNKQIRTNPQSFIDGALPEFEASKMYAPVAGGSHKL